MTAAILYMGAKLVIAGNLSVGELIAFNLLAGRISSPSCDWRRPGRISIRHNYRFARLGDILNTAPEPTYNPSRMALPSIRGNISFENVTFRYRIDSRRFSTTSVWTFPPDK